MRKREAVRFIRKMKEKIKEGKVVKDPNSLYEDKDGVSLYALKQSRYNDCDVKGLPIVREATCGCLIGLWYMVSKNENSFQPFAQFIGSVIPNKYGKDVSGATNVTKAGPKAMLRVLDKALKNLEA